MLSRIVVIAPNWLGDAVMALPAIAAIRACRPAATILVAGRASTAPLFSMVSAVSAVVSLDSRGGMVGAISWAEDVASLRSTRADIAVLLPNSFRSAWTAYRAGIPERWGYAADVRGRLLTRKVPRLRGRFHQAEYYLRLVEALGFVREDAAAESPDEPDVRPARAAAADERDVRPTPAVASDERDIRPTVHVESGFGRIALPRLSPPPEAHQRADTVLARLGLSPDALLVGLAPGAAYGKAKQWPPHYYGALAAHLHAGRGATSLIFGARADASTSAAVSRVAARERQNGKGDVSANGEPVTVDLAGQTDLPLLVALMTRCAAVVSNDSGAMHVAAAAGVPVTAIFGASDERGTAPLRCEAESSASHEVLSAPAWCRPCMLRECPIDHRCMRRVLPERVAEAVESLLD